MAQSFTSGFSDLSLASAYNYPPELEKPEQTEARTTGKQISSLFHGMEPYPLL